ncbi:MAG: hypothetical protein R6W82_01580 [bacterium]
MRAASVESLKAEYGDDVHFVILYQREAHPNQLMFKEIDQPTTMEQRRELARRSRSDLDITTIIAIDEMDDAVRKAYGGAPNSAFIIDTSGRIVYRKDWAIPDEWRPVLERLTDPAPGSPLP